jgi:hypothetical protein
VWAQGGRHLLDERDLAPTFAEIGLRVVRVCPLGGAVSRLYQTLIFNWLNYVVLAIHQRTIGKLFPKLKSRNPMWPCYRLVNATTARLDRLLPLWRIGHCIVVERAD